LIHFYKRNCDLIRSEQTRNKRSLSAAKYCIFQEYLNLM